MSEKLKVGILGATGMVGQRFITLLENHPWFEVVTLAASAHSAGKTYAEAVGDRWKMETPMPEYVKNMVVVDGDDAESVASGVDFMFSAVNMPKDQIRAIEERYAKTETPVVSNNSAHRWTPDVPMVVPEINPEHFEVIEHQRKRLGTTRGFIAVKPNCSIQAEHLERLLLGLRFLTGDERDDVAHHLGPVLEGLARAGNRLVGAHNHLARLEFLPRGQRRRVGLNRAVRLDGDETTSGAQALALVLDHLEVLR